MSTCHFWFFLIIIPHFNIKFYILDAFADAADAAAGGTLKPIHIRIQQRNGRKTLTTVQGIPDDYDPKRIVRAFKKVLSFAFLPCVINSKVNHGRGMVV